ncbi:GNAT family N-acyltransferase [Larsenimonas rhizosphaerae]|uniref:GNAT family N-acetyltransferase n=1 Tax=Larsenimonas rhizosphaerae TaxID=2944682 RepID=A0AA42CXX1_9GAMM|nr:GNAT family N-acyltransferase [Larsenimonas rhizosphaerae]MCX2524378.1 GNAT family N-acetyltransferase [Larsenimonas rhizosphaerae]
MNVSEFERYCDAFGFSVINSFEDYVACCEFRRGVYYNKFGYLSGDDLIDEWDEFDDRSVHLALKHKDSDTMVGYFRVVCSIESTLLPIESYYQDCFFSDINPDAMNRDGICELSRFSLLTRVSYEKENFNFLDDEELLLLGLSRHALATSIASVVSAAGRDHAFALVEPRFVRLIKGSNVFFKRVGDFQDLYGKRAPYYVKCSSLVASFPPDYLSMFESIRNDIRGEVSSIVKSFSKKKSWRDSFHGAPA